MTITPEEITQGFCAECGHQCPCSRRFGLGNRLFPHKHWVDGGVCNGIFLDALKASKGTAMTITPEEIPIEDLIAATTPEKARQAINWMAENVNWLNRDWDERQELDYLWAALEERAREQL